jgi:hypothetical protein
MWVTSVIFTELPKVNNSPLGENSPNLVTLLESISCSSSRLQYCAWLPVGNVVCLLQQQRHQWVAGLQNCACYESQFVSISCSCSSSRLQYCAWLPVGKSVCLLQQQQQQQWVAGLQYYICLAACSESLFVRTAPQNSPTAAHRTKSKNTFAFSPSPVKLSPLKPLPLQRLLYAHNSPPPAELEYQNPEQIARSNADLGTTFLMPVISRP